MALNFNTLIDSVYEIIDPLTDTDTIIANLNTPAPVGTDPYLALKFTVE